MSIPYDFRCRPAICIVACLALCIRAASATAAVDCTATVNGVAFGVYDPTLSTPLDSAGSVTVVCNYIAPGSASNISYSLQLSTGSSSSYSQRMMSAGAGRLLGYNLYRDAGRTQVLGSGTGGTFVLSDSVTVGPGVGNGTRTTTYSIYGRMPALQDALTGSYADTIVATLTF